MLDLHFVLFGMPNWIGLFLDHLFVLFLFGMSDWSVFVGMFDLVCFWNVSSFWSFDLVCFLFCLFVVFVCLDLGLLFSCLVCLI